MGSIANGFCTSAKSEFFVGGHCFAGTVTPTGTVSGTAVSAVSSMAGVNVGMLVAGAGFPSNTYVAQITGAAAFVASQSGSGTATLTISGDIFKLALIIPSPTGNYGAATVNYTDLTGNSDEVSGPGYSAGGVALQNSSPSVSGTTAYITFGMNPSFTTATFSSAGCIIYNTGVRVGGNSGTSTDGTGRSVGVFSFGGTQTVVAGTFTILLPANTSSQATFRIA
jgi:hypothetical protein